jgi:hypothetical protein
MKDPQARANLERLKSVMDIIDAPHADPEYKIGFAKAVLVVVIEQLEEAVLRSEAANKDARKRWGLDPSSF